MRLILLMVSLVIVSLLVMKGYSAGGSNTVANPVGERLADPLQKASEVNQLIEDAASKQRQALEKQLQQ